MLFMHNVVLTGLKRNPPVTVYGILHSVDSIPDTINSKKTSIS